MTGIYDAARALVEAVADGDRDDIIGILGHEPFTNTGAPAGTADYLAALAVVLAEACVDDERALVRVLTSPATIDEIAIDRRLAGDPVYLNADEMREAVRVGFSRGMHPTALSRALGISGPVIRRLADAYRRRHEQRHPADLQRAIQGRQVGDR